MLGKIESFRRDIATGIILCEDGRKVRFTASNIINARSSLVGEEVDFLLDGRSPHSIVVLAGSPWSVFSGSTGTSTEPDQIWQPAIDWRMAA